MRTLRLIVLLTVALGASKATTEEPRRQFNDPFASVFAIEASLSDPTSLVTGPDGYLYVSSQSGGAVLRFDSVTGGFVDEFAGGDLPVDLKRLFTPTGLTFGADGHLYVASLFTSSVLRFDGISGEFIDTFVPSGSGGLSFANNVTFGPDGALYVTSLLSNQVLRYDGASGAFVDEFVVAGSGGLARPEGLQFGPDGNLYVSSFGTGQVLQYNGVTGGFVRVFANGTFADDLTFGPDGHLYVSADFEIRRYDGKTGAFLDVFAQGGRGNQGLLFAPSGDLLAASFFTDQILRFNGMTGTLVGVFASKVGLDQPNDIAFGPDGNLYVSSEPAGILRFDRANGRMIDVFAAIPNPVVRVPVGLRDFVFGPDGRIFATSRNASDPAVLQFNGTSGAFIGPFVERGAGGVSNPSDLAFGRDGHLYVSSSNTDEILRYDGSTGEFLGAFVTAGDGGLDFPHGLTFGPDGHLYVADQRSSLIGEPRILRYDGRTGAFIDVFATSPLSLNSPFELLFGPDGALYVASAGNRRVIRFNGTTGAFIDEFVPFEVGGLSKPNGLAFGPDGDLYVASEETDRVLRYAARSRANVPPKADAGPNQQSVECTSPDGAGLTLDGTASTDPDGDPLTFEWTDGNGKVVGTTAKLSLSVDIGAHSFTLRVTDGRGGSDQDTVSIVVDDTTSPSISGLHATPNIVWPPDHRMVNVVVASNSRDRCSSTVDCQLVLVTSNEPEDERGDGRFTPDWKITGPMTVNVRAERQGRLSGRSYTLQLECIDSSGNSATSSTEVTVPHDMR